MPYKQSSNPLSRKTSPLRRSPFKNTDPALQHENSISDDEHFRLSSNTDEHSVMIDGSTYDPEFDAATNTKEKVAEYYKKNPKPEDIVKNVQAYVPGYQLRVPPIIEDDRVTTTVQVEGAGDFLPKYSGNLDIMTAAAVAVAEYLAENAL